MSPPEEGINKTETGKEYFLQGALCVFLQKGDHSDPEYLIED